MENIVEKLKRERVLGESARDLQAMQARGEWLGISPMAAAETNLSIAGLDPLTTEEKTLFGSDPVGTEHVLSFAAISDETASGGRLVANVGIRR